MLPDGWEIGWVQAPVRVWRAEDWMMDANFRKGSDPNRTETVADEARAMAKA